jgi:hypothetical protein
LMTRSAEGIFDSRLLLKGQRIARVLLGYILDISNLGLLIVPPYRR